MYPQLSVRLSHSAQLEYRQTRSPEGRPAKRTKKNHSTQQSVQTKSSGEDKRFRIRTWLTQEKFKVKKKKRKNVSGSDWEVGPEKKQESWSHSFGRCQVSHAWLTLQRAQKKFYSLSEQYIRVSIRFKPTYFWFYLAKCMSSFTYLCWFSPVSIKT